MKERNLAVPAPQWEVVPGRPGAGPISNPLSWSTSPEGGEDQRESLPPLEFGRVLLRYKGTLLGILAFTLLVTAAISYWQTPIYRASVSLEIQGINENFLNLREVDPTATPISYTTDTYIQTQAEVLQDRALLDRVVARLSLDQRREFSSDTGLWRRIARLLRLPAPPPPTPAEQALAVARDNLRVVPTRQSRIIRMHYDSQDPQTAADFVNTLSEEFINYSLEARWTATTGTKAWLQDQLAGLRSRLEQSEQTLQSYASQHGLLLTGAKDSVAEEKLRQLQTELSRAEADRMARRSLYEVVARTGGSAVPTALDSPTLRDYQMRLTELRRQRAELEPLLKPENYKMVRLEAQIRELEAALRQEREQIVLRSKNEYDAALTRESQLTAAYARQSGLVSDQAVLAIRYSVLLRDVETNRQLYDAMLQRVKEAEIASAIRPSNIRLIGPASLPSAPYKPNLPLNLAIGAVGGWFLGCGAVVYRYRTRRRLETPGDTVSCLRLPELGTIPAARSAVPRSEGLRGMLGLDRSAGAVELITWQSKVSEMSESFRSTLLSILSARNGNPAPLTLVVTSPCAGEGKTTVTSNLAIAMAETGRRVLIVDADLRNPRLQEVFGVANSWGLSDLIGDDNSIDQLPASALARATQIPNLFLIPSGPGVENVPALLHAPRLAVLLKRFREEFDFVLVDAPPVLQFSDARIVARWTDGVVLVVRSNRTRTDAALEAARRLLLDSAPVLGTILNDWDPESKLDRYSYDRYGYYYRRRS